MCKEGKGPTVEGKPVRGMYTMKIEWWAGKREKTLPNYCPNLTLNLTNRKQQKTENQKTNREKIPNLQK